MTKILLHGACGRMGHWIADTVSGERDCKIVAGVDPSGEAYGEFPVYPSLAEVKETADVIIDFSSATAVDALLAYAAERKLPLVLWDCGASFLQYVHRRESADQGPAGGSAGSRCSRV